MLESCSFQSNEVFISVDSSSKVFPSCRDMGHAPDIFGLAGQSETNPNEIPIKPLLSDLRQSRESAIAILIDTVCVCGAVSSFTQNKSRLISILKVGVICSYENLPSRVH